MCKCLRVFKVQPELNRPAVTWKDAFDGEGPVPLAGRLAPLQTEAQAGTALLKLHGKRTVGSCETKGLMSARWTEQD